MTPIARVLDDGARSSARSTRAADDVAGGRARTPTSCSSPRRSARSAQTVARRSAARRPDCVVSDVGSTKRVLADAGADERFIGGHPLAGAETAGVEHAREDLFDGAIWYLTPARGSTAGVLYERLHRLLTTLGAQPDGDRRRDPRPPDGVRLAPAARARQPARRAGRRALLGGAEPAARCRRSARASATRRAWPAPTARSGPTSTSSNRDALIAAIDEFAGRLAEVRAALAAGDARGGDRLERARPRRPRRAARRRR